MVHLIDKDALVAELERLISNGQVKLQESQESNDYESYVAWAEHIATCIKVLSFLDTLEVKEVDLEKGVKDYIYALPHSRTGIPGGWKCSWPEEEVIKIAKHFFELGLKSKGEKV